MATLTELKNRVTGELARDDMGAGGEAEQRLVDAYTRAIEHHAGELFWFNRKSGTVSTSVSAATVSPPAGMRIPLIVSLRQQPLRKVALEEIEHRTDRGVPSRWAENEGAIQLWPIPDGIYALTVSGIAELGVPASSNEWTTEAYDLIAARTRMLLCRDTFRDAEGALAAAQAEAEALARLRRETRRRGRAGLGTDLIAAPAFDIVAG